MFSNGMTAHGTTHRTDRATLEMQHAARLGRQLGDTQRAELQRVTASADEQRLRARASAPEKRSASLRNDDPKVSFFRDRKSTGLRQELLQSGRTIQRLQVALARERHYYTGAMTHAWQFEETQRARFFEFHGRELKRERDYHVSMMAIRNGEANRLREHFSQIVGRTEVAVTPVAQAPSGTVPADAPQQESPAVTCEQSCLVQPLTCVRVVGESRLPRGLDVLCLISSFLMSTDIPIDLVVSRGALHMTAWLFANGAKPTARTAHVAVNTGCFTMTQLVFRYLTAPLDTDVFADLPIGGHTAIAEWLMREYPAHMASEFTRLASSDEQLPQRQWAWYADRLQRQWEWEDAIDEGCWQRKRARLRGQTDPTFEKL